jgi:thioesterase domain-containing protein
MGKFCDGGNVAFEIAQQPEAKGDEVSALVLFEYYSPYAVIPKKSMKYVHRHEGKLYLH